MKRKEGGGVPLPHTSGGGDKWVFFGIHACGDGVKDL